MPSMLLLFALLTFSAPVLAVYKCESNNQTIYSDLPCHDGKTDGMKEISITAPATDTKSAQKKLQEDKRELQRLQQQRQKQEALEARQQEKRYKAVEAKKKKCAESAQRVKWANEDAVSANPKTMERAKRKAQRAEEKHQLACGQ